MIDRNGTREDFKEMIPDPVPSPPERQRAGCFSPVKALAALGFMTVANVVILYAS